MSDLDAAKNLDMDHEPCRKAIVWEEADVHKYSPS